MNVVIIWLDWFWCLAIAASVQAYTLGILMRRFEERQYERQQLGRAYKHAVCWRR